MLGDIQISTLETAAETFGGIVELERACGQYRRELAGMTPDSWKLNLANIERINPSVYATVVSMISADKIAEVNSFVSQYKGQPLPEIQLASTLSEAKAIAAAKGGGTIVKP